MKTNTNSYRGYRFPHEIISHGVWLYHRFTLSLRDVEELLAKRSYAIYGEPSIRMEKTLTCSFRDFEMPAPHRDILPSVDYITQQYANNRAEGV